MGKCFSLTLEQREKIRLAKLGTKHSEETKAKMSLSRKGIQTCLGYRHTEQARRNMSLARIGNKNNLGHKASTETRAKMSAVHSGCNNAFYGKRHTLEAREAVRLSRLGKPTTLGRKASQETRLRISQSCSGVSRKSATRSRTYRRLWANPVWAMQRVSRIMGGLSLRPNKAEMLLFNLLSELYPDDWKYVGDGSLIIGRLNPDFVNVNGKKQIIELFGDYWHKEQEEQARINRFTEYGFATLIIWENELKDLGRVTNKIREFSECRTGQSRASRGGDAPGKCRDFIRSIPKGDKEKVQS